MEHRNELDAEPDDPSVAPSAASDSDDGSSLDVDDEARWRSKARKKKAKLVSLAVLAALAGPAIVLGVGLGTGTWRETSSSTALSANDGADGDAGEAVTMTLEDCLAMEEAMLKSSTMEEAAHLPPATTAASMTTTEPTEDAYVSSSTTAAPVTTTSTTAEVATSTGVTEAPMGTSSTSKPADEAPGGEGITDGSYFPLYNFGSDRKLRGEKEAREKHFQIKRTCNQLVAAHRASNDKISSSSIIVTFSSSDGLNEVKAHVDGRSGVLKLKGGARKFSRPQKVRASKGNRKKKGRSTNDGVEEEGETEAMLGYVVVEAGAAKDVEAEALELEALEGVASAERDGVIEALDREKYFSIRRSSGHNNRRRLGESMPWGIEAINVARLWDIAPKKHVKVCIADTGYDLGHADLPNHENVTGTSFVDGEEWNVDGDGHGTHVAGTIGAIGNNDVGVVGVNPNPERLSFHIAKVLDSEGQGDFSSLIDAILDCVERGSDVITMSLGCGQPQCYSAALDGAFQDAYDQGVIMVAASGNSGSDATNYPAGYGSVISVGAIAESGYLAASTSRSDQTEITAPGSLVNSTWPNDTYLSLSGTSMAAPHVAGVVALLASHFPECANNQIRNALIQSAAEPPTNDARNTQGWDKYYGWGILDASAAYDLLSEGCVEAGGIDPLDMGFDNAHEAALGGSDQKTYGCTSDGHCSGIYGGEGVENKCDTDNNLCLVECSVGKVVLELELTTDSYPQETSWMLTKTCSDSLVDRTPMGAGLAPNTTYTERYCVDDSAYEFMIYDSYADGFCCSYGPGAYNITFGGNVVASGGVFGSWEATTWGSCEQDQTLNASLSDMGYCSDQSGRCTIDGDASECECFDLPVRRVLEQTSTLSPETCECLATAYPTSSPTSNPTVPPTESQTMDPLAPSISIG